MEVVVQLAHHAAAASEGPSNRAAFDIAQKFGVTLEAIHPESDDPILSRWFHAELDNGKAADLLRHLRNVPEVTAAYVKPPAEVP